MSARDAFGRVVVDSDLRSIDEDDSDRPVCARCVANWRETTRAVREFLRERGAA